MTQSAAADPRTRMIRAAEKYMPYLGLAVALLLAMAAGRGGAATKGALLGISAAALLWMLCLKVPTGGEVEHSVRGVVYGVGLELMVVVLILINPWYGFFGFTGYLNVGLMPGLWKIPLLVTNAAAMAVSYVGGLWNIHGLGIVLWAVLSVVNVGIAGAMTYAWLLDEQQSAGRVRTIDALGEANRRLETMMEENAGLHAQLVAQAREAGMLDERQRMAGEIHDTIAQGLTGIVAQLEAAERGDADPERRRRHMGLARDLARESLAEARRSVQALRPGPLEDARLPEALSELVRRWTETSGVPVRLEVDGAAIPLQPALEVVLFRAAQESLANIAKHANANRAGITLSYTYDVVVLDVLDDGAGFDPAAAGSAEPPAAADAPGPAGPAVPNGNGYGLSAMRQRLRQVGGTLEIESTPGDGTTVSASVPTLRRVEGDA
ncbi:MAG TPA: sensor histidine kinase [Actinocrinis sp.]|jgi:signal transduction histidine kinase